MRGAEKRRLVDHHVTHAFDGKHGLHVEHVLLVERVRVPHFSYAKYNIYM